MQGHGNLREFSDASTTMRGVSYVKFYCKKKAHCIFESEMDQLFLRAYLYIDMIIEDLA